MHFLPHLSWLDRPPLEYNGLESKKKSFVIEKLVAWYTGCEVSSCKTIAKGHFDSYVYWLCEIHFWYLSCGFKNHPKFSVTNISSLQQLVFASFRYLQFWSSSISTMYQMWKLKYLNHNFFNGLEDPKAMMISKDKDGF